jgi:hypothetical protein
MLIAPFPLQLASQPANKTSPLSISTESFDSSRKNFISKWSVRVDPKNRTAVPTTETAFEMHRWIRVALRFYDAVVPSFHRSKCQNGDVSTSKNLSKHSRSERPLGHPKFESSVGGACLRCVRAFVSGFVEDRTGGI